MTYKRGNSVREPSYLQILNVNAELLEENLHLIEAFLKSHSELQLRMVL